VHGSWLVLIGNVQINFSLVDDWLGI